MDGTRTNTGAGIRQLREREHELRAALCGIESAASALKDHRERMRSNDVDALVEAIAVEARRLQQMLAPGKARRASFDLAEAVGVAITLARAAGLSIRANISTASAVLGNREHTTQVVVALLENARLHAPGSAVDVRLHRSRRTTTLFVEDRGPGVDRSTCEQLFERGVRGARSEGSGLGLFIARRLMIEQGGSLMVEPRVGGGASFVLQLATAQAAVATAEDAAVTRQSVGVR